MKRTHKKKRRSGNRAQISYPVQLALALGGTVLAAWLLVAFLGKVVYPYRLGNKVGHDLNLVQNQLVQQKSTNSTLRKQIQSLKTTEGIEREAHRARFRKGKEMIYLLQQPLPTPMEPLRTRGKE